MNWWLLLLILVVAIVIIMYTPSKVFVGGASTFFASIVDRQKGKSHFSLKDEPELITVVGHKSNPRINDFWFTPEGVYSMSTEKSARETNRVIARALGRSPKSITITDATACIGGNSIPFAEYFSRVNSVEVDQNNYAALKHNVELLNLSNITLHNSDYTKVYKDLPQDVVFADPPWGGIDYKSADKVRLKLGDMFIEDIVKDLPCDVFVKVPLNFDLDKYRDVVSDRESKVVYEAKYKIIWTKK